MPGRRLYGDLSGCLLGLRLFLAQRAQWPAVERFRVLTGSALSSRAYRRRFFLTKGRDWFWEDMAYEPVSGARRFFDVQGAEAVERAVRSGSGAVLIGAHYGPSTAGLLLEQAGMDVRVLAADNVVEAWRSQAAQCGRRWVTGKCRFLSDPARMCVSGSGERAILRHLRRGGLMMTHLDLPNRGRGVDSLFFGQPVRFHYFPVKLALRHGAPVFFFDTATRDARGVYRLVLRPAGSFVSLEEGIARYAAFFEARILRHPFAWKRLPNFFGMLASQA